jgi:hypothetical protein
LAQQQHQQQAGQADGIRQQYVEDEGQAVVNDGRVRGKPVRGMTPAATTAKQSSTSAVRTSLSLTPSLSLS